MCSVRQIVFGSTTSLPMAASQVSGMKMRTLLLGLFLGLLAVVHSTPVHNVTQIPAKAEDEVIREAATDGFLVENISLPLGAAGSPATELPATELRGSPAAELPAAELPATELRGLPATELPATELRGLPAAELPATELPATELLGLPAAELPATELLGLPAAELPATELQGLPAAELPATELPATELRGLPAAELPAAELPAAELPATELLGLPAAELPAAELPATELRGLPAAELPATELQGLPAAELPATELPATELRGLPAAELPATELPATNATVQASQRPAAGSKEVVAIEGSGVETIDEVLTSVSLQFGTTTASHAPSSASTMLPKETGDSSSVSSATQSPPSGSTPVPIEAQPSATPDRISASQTTDPAVSSVGFLSTRGSDSGFLSTRGSDSGFLSTRGSDLGSGDGEMLGPYFTATTRSSMTSSSSAETSAASPTSTTRQKVPVVFPGSEGSGSGEGLETVPVILPTTTGMRNRQRMINEPNNGKIYETEPAATRAEGTPGWMIIVGFIVGLAALVMLFVAIATRDKWNGPSMAPKLEDKTNSSNQQREVEMQTFLPKDDPRENGHGSEYTVIPLEELPEKYSSH